LALSFLLEQPGCKRQVDSTVVKHQADKAGRKTREWGARKKGGNSDGRLRDRGFRCRPGTFGGIRAFSIRANPAFSRDGDEAEEGPIGEDIICPLGISGWKIGR